MFKQTLKFFIFALVIGHGLACKQRRSASKEESSNTTLKESPYLRAPESILSQIRDVWKINISQADEDKYISNTFRFLGGAVTDRRQAETLIPGPFYVIAVDSLSYWLAPKIIEKQKSCENDKSTSLACGQGLSCPFRGRNSCSNNNGDAVGCFADSSKAWCDFDDRLSLRGLNEAPEFKKYFAERNLSSRPFNSALPEPTNETKKRVLHNIQDLGEYLLTPLDNVTDTKNGGTRNSAEYLAENVFWPAFRKFPDEEDAWRQVIYTILVSGGFFMRVDDLMSGSAARDQ